MVCYTWTGCNYSHLIGLDDDETAALIAFYDTVEAVNSRNMTSDGYHWYLVNDAERIIAPLRFLAYAFGGGYGNDLPYGEETTCHFSLSTISEYRLEKMNMRATR